MSGLERQGIDLVFVTTIKVRSGPDQVAVLLPEVNPLVYTYGLALFAALMLVRMRPFDRLAADGETSWLWLARLPVIGGLIDVVDTAGEWLGAGPPLTDVLARVFAAGVWALAFAAFYLLLTWPLFAIWHEAEGKRSVQPDVTASRIIREDVAPAFRDGRFAAGIDAGVNRVIAVVGGSALPPTSTALALTVPVVASVVPMTVT